jgi:hypothetical protein
MSQATAAEPATRQGPLELSRVQMNVVFVTILLGLLLSALDGRQALLAPGGRCERGPGRRESPPRSVNSAWWIPM